VKIVRIKSKWYDNSVCTRQKWERDILQRSSWLSQSSGKRIGFITAVVVAVFWDFGIFVFKQRFVHTQDYRSSKA